MKLLRSFVVSVFLYFCELWALAVGFERGAQSFEMRFYRRLLNILIRIMLPIVTNEEVHRKIQAAIEKYDEFLTLVKKRKLR